MIDKRSLSRRWAITVLLLAILAVVAGLAIASGAASAQQISTDTTYRDQSLVWTEDVEVVGGAKLAIKGCDVTFRPPGSTPLYLMVTSGSLEVLDSDLVGEGAGFIVRANGDSVLRNVTATGLGAVANASLPARGLPLATQGGLMFYNSKLTVFNLDITGAPATGLYVEDCDASILSMGVKDACTAYTGTDQCAAVAITYLGSPWNGPAQRTVVINTSKVIGSANHGILVAAAATGYDATVSIQGTEVSSSGGSALVVYEVSSHEGLRVTGDGDDLHHSKAHGILWVRSGTLGTSSMDMRRTTLSSNEGSGLRVMASGSVGVSDLTLASCTIEDTLGHGAAVTATGCTQVLNVTLRDCTVTACGGTGLYFTTDTDGKTSAYRMKLDGTRLAGSKSYGVYSRVSQSYSSVNLTFKDSQVVGGGSDGIHSEYSLDYFSYLEAPRVTANMSLDGTLVADNKGYGVYEYRHLRSYYSWAVEKSTLYASISMVGSEVRNHTKSAVVVVPSGQFQYCTYSSEAYIIGSRFTNNSGHGYYEKVDSLTATNAGSNHLLWYFRGSAFRQLTHSGVYIEMRRADGASLSFEVHGCTFEALGQYGACLYASATPYAGSLSGVLEDCTFNDIVGYAYNLWPGTPDATSTDFELVVRRVTADNTTGIYASIDGAASECDYAITLEDINVTHTLGNAIDVRVHPAYVGRMMTRIQDVYTRYTNGTALGITYTSDRNQNLFGEVDGDRITLLDQEGGMLLYEHQGRIDNLTIKGSSEFDLHKVDNRLPTGSTGVLELHSASMDRKSVKVVGGGSLWVWNALRVKVEWQNGMAALGAGVQVQDRTFEVVAVGHVDTEEGMAPVELLAYILDAVEFRSRSPFIVNITFLDLEQTGVCSLDEPATVRIAVFDRVAPSVVVLQPDDGASQRASFFELRGSAFDAHAGLHRIRYRLDGGNWTELGATSPFRTNVTGVGPGEHLLEVEVSDRAGNAVTELVHIEVDNQPPSLVVVSPKGDVHTRDPVLIVRGETEDGAEVSINGEEVESLHGLFIHEVHLEEGANTVTVVSMDRLSNVATVRFIAFLDTVEPFLDVQSHEDGDWVSSTSQVLSGIIEEGCTLTVQGKAVEVVGGTFDAPVTLSKGSNTVTLRATDPAGNVNALVLSLYVASEPPWVHLEAPEDGAYYDRREVRVLGTVQTASEAYVNGRKVSIKQGLIDELLILPEGMSTIMVEAMDPAGNVQRVSRVVIVDTVAPVLTLDPLPATTRVASRTLSGTAEGATRLDLNGEEVTIAGTNGTFSVNVTLAEGTNVLRLTAYDGVGHSDVASAEVVLDTRAPYLRLVLPTLDNDDNGSYYSRQRGLSMQVVSEPGAKITYNGVYVIVGEDGVATVDLELKPAGEPTRVSFTVEDELGNSQELNYTITYSPRGAEEESTDLLSLGMTLVYIALLAAMVVMVARYRAQVKRAARRPPPRGRPPNVRRPPNGQRHGARNGGGNGNGGRRGDDGSGGGLP